MTKVIYDLAVKTGSYIKDGQTKGRYLNVGKIMEDKDGGKFVIMNRAFNAAGVPNPENRDTVLISCFTPKPFAAPAQQPAPDQGMDDDLSF
jgi:hypothetical protein|tara:strand:- start:911 stop:1183 length:273 start_codon:yes stop_codon:yes gene_type:complete